MWPSLDRQVSVTAMIAAWWASASANSSVSFWSLLCVRASTQISRLFRRAIVALVDLLLSADAGSSDESWALMHPKNYFRWIISRAVHPRKFNDFRISQYRLAYVLRFYYPQTFSKPLYRRTFFAVIDAVFGESTWNLLRCRFFFFHKDKPCLAVWCTLDEHYCLLTEERRAV